jgi:uncharacterized membrane protein
VTQRPAPDFDLLEIKSHRPVENAPGATTMAGTTLLTALQMAEVSVVDRPATELDGFMLIKSAKGIAKERRAFMQLLRDIRKADWSDEQKIEAARKAVDAAPTILAEPVLEEMALEQSIIEQYGLAKDRHDARGDDGSRLARKPEGPAAEAGGSLPWRHGGASLLRGAP